MKAQNLIITALFFLLTISFLPGNSESAVKNNEQSKKEQTISASSEKFTLTYERVFKDGIWWIFVYDGGVLIACYPED